MTLIGTNAFSLWLGLQAMGVTQGADSIHADVRLLQSWSPCLPIEHHGGKTSFAHNHQVLDGRAVPLPWDQGKVLVQLRSRTWEPFWLILGLILMSLLCVLLLLEVMRGRLLQAHLLQEQEKRSTEAYNLTQTIAYQAAYDSLTGLLNRNEFDTRLRQAVKRVQERGIPAVLAYLDLDQFKILNDTAGHLVGDQLLTELAQLLQQNMRSSDSLARLGGDEFGLLLEGCSLEQGRRLSQLLVDRINDYHFTWRGRRFQVGGSIGLVPISGDVVNVLDLLSRADLACYKAKDMGRGRVYIAAQDDTELDRQHLELVHIANIPQAIEENRFHLMEQPIISLLDSTHRHVEILLRLQDEHGNMVSPNLFIPMAERYGMIGLIDRWVVKTVLTNYHRYYPDANTMVAINLSGSSLSDERFTEYVVQLLHQSLMPAEYLCFEITETTTISQLDQALKFIATLKQLGVSFALDDFGSGVSSFGYLRQLPVDYLKIDGELIRNIESEEYICTIVDMVNQVASMMGMETIAEFVENDAVLARLRSLNVSYAQGYGIGKPTPLPRF